MQLLFEKNRRTSLLSPIANGNLRLLVLPQQLTNLSGYVDFLGWEKYRKSSTHHHGKGEELAKSTT